MLTSDFIDTVDNYRKSKDDYKEHQEKDDWCHHEKTVPRYPGQNMDDIGIPKRCWYLEQMLFDKDVLNKYALPSLDKI